MQDLRIDPDGTKLRLFIEVSTVHFRPKGSNLESVDNASFVKIARNDPDITNASEIFGNVLNLGPFSFDPFLRDLETVLRLLRCRRFRTSVDPILQVGRTSKMNWPYENPTYSLRRFSVVP